MQIIENILNDKDIKLNLTVNYLLSDIKNLNGVGDKIYCKLTNLIKGNKIIDLLYHFPISIVDRSYSPLLINAEPNRIVTIKLKILKHIKPYNKSQPYKVICSDGSDKITINFFKTNPKFIDALIKIGTTKIVSGNLTRWNNQLTMSNPDIITTEDKKEIDIPEFEPVYHLTAGVSNKILRKLITQVLNKITDLIKYHPIPEWLDKKYLQTSNIPSFFEAIFNIHFPKQTIISNDSVYRKRIAYDEILSSQLLLGLIRENEKSVSGISIEGNGKFKNKIINSLPFKLTNSQLSVINEIFNDMKSEKKMIRLIQGDVGSGKTIISLISMINAIECGYKCLLMAPTEILATQHFNKIKNIIKNSSLQDEIQVELLIGKDNYLEKKKKINSIFNNNIHIIVGTHALFQKGINIPNIGLIVIDEQHRFGVNQRLMLTQKGINADILSMTATPIPRTLAMTIYGDMDISVIDELPKGRITIDTKIVSLEQIDKIINIVQQHVDNNEKVYWVCPLIEESGKSKLTAVESRFNNLKKYFNEKVSIIHGKMKSDEKLKIMNDFSNKFGISKILVSTTVIEVGIDITDATLMIIENSERFGLSALHQLRGRIGRGNKKSICILLHGNEISDIAKKRLIVMKNINNGFDIAEEDLKIRGAGDIFGTDQSGVIKFKVADYNYDKNLFTIANNNTKFILNSDKDLTSINGKNLRILLSFFNQNNNIQNIYPG